MSNTIDCEEYVEYQVESGYMDDEETIGKSWITCFNKSEKESAILEYNRLKNGGEYDFVDLVERTMEEWRYTCSDIIMEWKKEEEVDDETIIQYRKEIEEGCPESYRTVWTNYGFDYEKIGSTE